MHSSPYEFHKPPRSPLWKSVNLAASIPGWTRFSGGGGLDRRFPGTSGHG
jgi:hypothetical protein